MSVIHRRGFLRSAAAAVPVLAFSPSAKAWLTCKTADAIDIPNLDGQILTAPAELEAAAQDWGYIVSKVPIAVLVPGSIADVVRVVRFANEHCIKIGPMSMVGNSHSTQGQSQAEAGLVIDMATLADIESIDEDSAVVGAGVRWIELLEASLPLGKSPPILTDYIDLSVGGTISVGGIGGQTFAHGLQADNVLELWVVTGEGKLRRCSPSKRPGLFDSVRCGLGQFAIIVKARVKLIDVEPLCRQYTAVYPDVASLMADQELLIADGRFDYVEGLGFPNPDDSYTLVLECVKRYAPGDPPDDAALTGDLQFIPGTLGAEDKPYFEFLNRLAPLVEFTQFTGDWFKPHPLMDVFLPRSAAAAFIEQTLANTPAIDIGIGPVLIYPFFRDKVSVPFQPLPDEPICYLFSLLRWASSDDPAVVADLLAKNRAVLDGTVAVGGKRYPIGSVEVDQADWIEHFGPDFPGFLLRKLQYDPRNVLTPGQGIFTW